MPVKINGATSGSVTLAAPATGSDVTLTLPASSGTVATTAYADGSGLVKIVDQTFSAGSAVSVNNCFTSTYQNYRVVLSGVQFAASSYAVRFRMRLSGTDATAANSYRIEEIFISGSSTVTASYLTGDYLTIGGASSGSVQSLMVLEIARPNDAVFTAIHSQCSYDGFFGIFGGSHSVATAYDGFTIYHPSSTLSGTVRVYGYRN